MLVTVVGLMTPDELRQALIQRRKEMGLTQYDLADRMGCRQGLVSNMELGKTFTRLETWERWAGALGLQWGMSVEEADDDDTGHELLGTESVADPRVADGAQDDPGRDGCDLLLPDTRAA